MYDKLAYEKRFSLIYGLGVDYWEISTPTKPLVEFIDKEGSLGNKVIDLGCGEGRDSIYLAKHGFDVTGVDISVSAIDKARARCKKEDVYVNFIVGDVCSLMFIRDATYDLAIDVGCLQFIIDVQERIRYLSSIFRVLKDGGLYFSCNLGSREKMDQPNLFRKIVGEGNLVQEVVVTVDNKKINIQLPIIPVWPKSDSQYKQEFEEVGFKLINYFFDTVNPIGDCWIFIMKRP
jgi:ubiquinone/menaquinone biosynthesis C-methylase UbiE